MNDQSHEVLHPIGITLDRALSGLNECSQFLAVLPGPERSVALAEFEDIAQILDRAVDRCGMLPQPVSEIVDYSESFGIDVGGTSEGNWIHKTANESWTAPETYVTVTSSGGQTIHAPAASAGSSGIALYACVRSRSRSTRMRACPISWPSSPYFARIARIWRSSFWLSVETRT